MFTYKNLHKSYISFFKERGHVNIPASPLVLNEDSTTLFTSSGMQPLVPYLLGQRHPMGTSLVNVQPCIRTVDIDEVGDNRHTTFFEMLGNWSLGDYYKKEQINWIFEFLTKDLQIDLKRLWFTVFEGNTDVPKDDESAAIWKSLGVSNDRIKHYGVEKNWWSRSGPPDKMPVGEIGGPSTEVFYEFDHVEHDLKFGSECHPNCDCGRFMEICNSVFIQYKKNDDGKLVELEQKNVDFGGGVERLLSAVNNNSDIFLNDTHWPIISVIEEITGKRYDDLVSTSAMRVIADHLKSAVFLILNGVIPSNKEHGYILRRLLRRSAVKMRMIAGASTLASDFQTICSRGILQNFVDEKDNEGTVNKVIKDEVDKFSVSIDRGLQYYNKLKDIELESQAFNLYQSYGFPFEITAELALQRGISISREVFDQNVQNHRKLSQTVSTGVFKGGLADNSGQVIKYHTATHLIHKALRDIIGDGVRQEGSNITGARLRFDFSSPRKLENSDIKKIEKIVNAKISEQMPVFNKIISKDEALKIGAFSFFREKYGSEVSIYYIGGSEDDIVGAYSKEFCGGPHVKNTGEIGKIKVNKVEKIGANTFRLYAS